MYTWKGASLGDNNQNSLKIPELKCWLVCRNVSIKVRKLSLFWGKYMRNQYRYNEDTKHISWFTVNMKYNHCTKMWHDTCIPLIVLMVVNYIDVIVFVDGWAIDNIHQWTVYLRVPIGDTKWIKTAGMPKHLYNCMWTCTQICYCMGGQSYLEFVFQSVI